MIFLFWRRRRGRGRRGWSAGAWIAFILLLLAGYGVSVRVLAWVIWILLAVGVIGWLARHWPRPTAAPRPAPERLDATLPLNPRFYHRRERGTT